jgi:superfamily II DNA or RNA helicase
MKSVGKLTRQGGLWVVTTGPDVLMRLKRIFPRASQTALGELRLKATDEVAFELRWIDVRFPLEIPDRPLLEAEAERYRAKQERLQSINLSLPLAQAFAMALPPRDYQGYAARLFRENGTLLVGDEIGLGKTVTAITGFNDPGTLPALAVVQAHLPNQWKAEINRFLPAARVHVVQSKQYYELPEADVYIISYSKLADWYEFLAPRVRSVAFDEVQELRRPESAKYKSAQLLASGVKYLQGLSATPVYNYGGEIWAIFNVLAPDVLGSREEFLREWCWVYNGKAVVKDPVALGSYLRTNHLFLRRTRKEVGRLLPPVVRYVQEINFDRRVYEQATSSADVLAQIILNGTFLERGTAAREFDLQLRRATGVAKAPYLAEFIRMLVESGEKVGCFAWHRAVHDVLAQRLADLKPVFYTGEETLREKEEAKAAFVKGPSSLMVLSNRSGSGLDGLQEVCSTVVIGELDWSPQIIDQCVGRFARDGQTASVNVFIPLAPVGSDPTMAEVLGLKRAQATGIVDLGAPTDSGFTTVDPARIRRLAEDFLRAKGRAVPARRLEMAEA